MRAVTTIFVMAILLAASLCTAAERDIVTQYYMAVGDYYDVPYETVYDISALDITDDQVPVVFFIAQKSNKAPAEVAQLRVDSKKWDQVARECGVTSTDFRMEVNGEITGEAYRPVYVKFAQTAKAEWDNIHLSDKEIINLVNMRFLSEHYGEAPARIIKLRGYATFVSMNNWIYSANEKTRTTELADESAGE